MAHAFHPSTQEAEAGGSRWVRGQPGLQVLVTGQAAKLQRNPVLKNKTKQKKWVTFLRVTGVEFVVHQWYSLFLKHNTVYRLDLRYLLSNYATMHCGVWYSSMCGCTYVQVRCQPLRLFVWVHSIWTLVLMFLKHLTSYWVVKHAMCQAFFEWSKISMRFCFLCLFTTPDNCVFNFHVCGLEKFKPIQTC